MSDLTINKSQAQATTPVTILHLIGHLHGETERLLIDYAHQAHDEGTKYLLLDLSNLEVLTSAGLRAIHNIFNLYTPQHDVDVIHEHGAEPYKSPYFKVVCPNPHIYYVLNIAGFLQNLLIFNDLDEAVNSFAG
jgi:anti-anti-sigma regulatory factor